MLSAGRCIDFSSRSSAEFYFFFLTAFAQLSSHVNDNARYLYRISAAYSAKELLLFNVLPLSGVGDKDPILVAAVERGALLQATVTQLTLVLFIWYSTGVEVSSSLRRIQVRLHSSALNLVRLESLGFNTTHSPDCVWYGLDNLLCLPHPSPLLHCISACPFLVVRIYITPGFSAG